jgi:hypothetical protein
LQGRESVSPQRVTKYNDVRTAPVICWREASAKKGFDFQNMK